MKIERLDEYITTAAAVLVGVAIAYWGGLLAGGGEIGTLLSLLGGIIFTALLLGMREQVWMLIPVCWILAGQLPEVKFNPTLRDVIVGGVGVATFMLVAFKVVRRRPTFAALDFWVWTTLLYLCTVFLRNPTGGLILASDRIGGRPYLNTAVAVAAYWVLSRACIPNKAQAHGLLWAMIGLRVGHGFMNVLANIFPGIIPFIARFYAGIDTSAIDPDKPVLNRGDAVDRRGYLVDVGEPIMRWQISRYRPFDIVNPFLAMVSPMNLLRLLIFLIGLALCLATGFRSGIAALFAIFAISTFLQQGLRAVGKLMLYAVMFLVLVIVVQSTVWQLPLSMQRALSFLPARWDAMAVADARASSQWRYYMWEQMLTTNKYIQSRWFGDGFGFSMRQFQLMQAAKTKSGEAGLQETFMIVGQVHSGPISAIRFVGYVGLVIHLGLIIAMAVEGWRLCKATKGTFLQPLTFFVCLPIIWEPVNFVFVFGSYDFALPLSIFGTAMLKMLRNTVDLHLPNLVAEQAPEPEEPLRPQRRFAAPVRRPSLAPRPTG